MKQTPLPPGLRLKRSLLRPIQVLPMGFFLLILLGTGLLLLPTVTVGEPLTFFDAFFTATSAVCVAGLTVVDTGLAFTTFGQGIILFLIQVGGLGFMAMAALLFQALRRRISLTERLIMAEAMNTGRLQGITELLLRAAKITFAAELAGTALLAIRFVPAMGFAKGLWFALFHAVSAFCNAGFDLIGGGTSLSVYSGDLFVNLVIMALIVLGGLGFTVIAECLELRRFRALSLHGKTVLVMTGILILLGAVVILLLEWTNPATLGPLPVGEKLLAGFFQSVTLRTAGLTTIDQAGLREATKLIGVLLMSVGASPAGTGGGVKTTTAALLFLGVWSVIRNHPEVNLFGRRVAWPAVRRALAVAMLFFGAMLLTTLLILAIEADTPAGKLGLANILYEVANAFTTGFSVGLTAAASPLSRALLMLGMFMGRVGPLTLAASFAGRESGGNGIRYPKGQLMIG